MIARDRDWWEDERDRDWFEFPRHPEIGDEVANNGILYVWDGRKWLRASTRGGRVQAPIIVSRQAPHNPFLGTLWFEPHDQKLAIWVGSRWMPVGGRGDFLSLKGGDIRGDLRVRGETIVNVFTVRPEEWPPRDEHDDRDNDHRDR